MTDIEASAKAFLIFGHRYQVVTAFTGRQESFTPGEQFVYVRTATSVRDASIGFFFYDTATGLFRRYDAHWGADPAPSDLTDFESVLVDLGPDMEYRQVSITGQLTDINWECFRKHADYLLAYIEGKEGIKSWYVWLEENVPELQTLTARAQLLRLKNSGPMEARLILAHLQIPFKHSPRYAWT